MAVQQMQLTAVAVLNVWTRQSNRFRLIGFTTPGGWTAHQVVGLKVDIEAIALMPLELNLERRHARLAWTGQAA
jgi:hypothetical protein